MKTLLIILVVLTALSLAALLVLPSTFINVYWPCFFGSACVFVTGALGVGAILKKRGEA